MKTKKIIINDCRQMDNVQLLNAMEAAIGYDAWLNDKRSDKDKPVTYQEFVVHESAKGTIIVNLKNAQ